MASITSWHRLEPQTGDAEVAAGAAARLADPLWLLARQWQVGEFQGEDGGSPIVARWRGRVADLRRRWLGPLPNTQVQAPRFDPAAVPLECLVERQPLPDDASGATGLRDAVEHGAQFLRFLSVQPTTGDYRDAFRTLYAVPPLTDAERVGLDPAALDYADLVAGRALDGRRLRRAIAGAGPIGLDPELEVQQGDRAEVLLACSNWLSWLRLLVSQPVAEADDGRTAWQPNRLEYAFALAARLDDGPFGDRTLSAERYDDGTLDWYSLDLNAEADLGTANDPAGTVVTRTVVPAPVTYPGMPAARFWEFEDAVLDLGALRPGAADLGQLLAIGTIGGFGNDWFVLPIELPVGSLVASRSLVITDTFGVRSLHRPNGDISIATGRAHWDMFQLAMPVDAADAFGVPITNLFYLAPTLVQPLQGDPLEEVVLLRDETANLAWAIERRLENPLGDGIDVTTGDLEPGLPELASSGDVPRYRLTTTVPPHWIPLLPVRVGDEVRLARGALPGTDGPVGSQSRLLHDPDAPNRPLLLPEEEVPREGVVVRRAYQAARSPDGRLHVWIGHRAGVGRGEGSSGLQFDTLSD